MDLALKTKFAAAMLAAALALPASAGPLDIIQVPGIEIAPPANGVGHLDPAVITDLGPQIVVPIDPSILVPYPSCPAGFDLAQSGVHVFHCRKTVSPTGAEAAVELARATSCAPNSYWTTGPEVFNSAHNGHLAVNFRCQH